MSNHANIYLACWCTKLRTQEGRKMTVDANLRTSHSTARLLGTGPDQWAQRWIILCTVDILDCVSKPSKERRAMSRIYRKEGKRPGLLQKDNGQVVKFGSNLSHLHRGLFLVLVLLFQKHVIGKFLSLHKQNSLSDFCRISFPLF